MVDYPGDVRLFINGSYADGAGEARQQVRSPVSGEVIGSVPVPVVNDSTCWWDINMPFGGAGGRRTGWGRIGGKHTLLGMTDLRTAAIQL